MKYWYCCNRSKKKQKQRMIEFCKCVFNFHLQNNSAVDYSFAKMQNNQNELSEY